MKFELISCASVDPKMLFEFLFEAHNFGEFCNPLWYAYDVGVAQFQQEEINSDADDPMREKRLCFMVNDALVGVCRITPRLKNIANGKVGFYIRKSKRKHKYAPVMIRLIEEWCSVNQINDVTAVVSNSNTASSKALIAAGWERTGKTYTWNDGRTAIEYSPKPCGT